MMKIVTRLFVEIRTVAAVLALAMSGGAWAQNRLELGLFGGVSYYMGDLNPSQQFKDPRPSFGVIGRYVLTDRMAVKGNVVLAGLEGHYPGSGDLYVGGSTTSADGSEATPDASYDFSRTIADAGAMFELNFMSYDHVFRKETRFTPYVTAGLAATCYKRYAGGNKAKPHFVLSLPFGFGAKYKVNEWLRLGLEWTLRKTFEDDLDVTTGTEGTIDPSDPYRNGHRALTHNNDWYSLCGMTLTFSMWPRKVKCSDGMRGFNR